MKTRRCTQLGSYHLCYWYNYNAHQFIPSKSGGRFKNSHKCLSFVSLQLRQIMHCFTSIHMCKWAWYRNTGYQRFWSLRDMMIGLHCCGNSSSFLQTCSRALLKCYVALLALVSQRIFTMSERAAVYTLVDWLSCKSLDLSWHLTASSNLPRPQ